MHRPLLLALLLALAAPAAASAERAATGSPDVRIRDGAALVEDAGGAWRVWDLRTGATGPRHEGRCGASRLLEWGRDIGPRRTAYVVVSLDALETRPVAPEPTTDDVLCGAARGALDRDRDGRSEPGAYAVLRVTGLGRYATALPPLQVQHHQSPSSLSVVGDDVWLGLDGGAAYVRLARRATAWSAPVRASRRPAGVEPDPTSDTRLLDDGALWRWTWTDLKRRGRLRIAGARRQRVDRRPRTTFSVASPVRGRRPQEQGACPSPRRVSVFGPETAVVDGRGRKGWGVSDGVASWRCGKGKARATYGIGDLHWLLRTTDGGRRWRLAGRVPVGFTLLGALRDQPLFERTDPTSPCPRPLVTRRGLRTVPVPCPGA